jgi:tryptophanyl-tRNA synthetase
VSNLLEILAAARRVPIPEAERSLADVRGYGDLKNAVAEAVVAELAPVRERYAELRPDEAALERTLALGADKARAIASEVLTDVRERMGVGPHGR